jgi:hypothetical protein
MDIRDLLINEGVKIGAYFIKNQKPKATTTIPTVQDLQERLKSLEPKNSEQFPQPVLENPIENKSIETGAKEGTACSLCSDEHLSEVSGALSEALRFARSEGLGSKEVIRRVRHARDELNAMERFDLAPEEITKLPEDEKEVAHWALPQSRDLRHSINSMITVEDLEKASAQAANLADTFSEKLIKCKPSVEAKENKTELSPEIEALKKMVEERKGK